ncbi:MAG: calcium-binding protein [Roseovarius sp.]|nr:calcium-binding protein [Roseovarius sp.]
MPIRLRHTGTVHAENFEFAQGAAAIAALPDGHFSVADYATGVTRLIRPGPAGPALVEDWWHESGQRTELPLPGHPGALPPALIAELLDSWEAGARSARPAYLAEGGIQAEAASLLGLRQDGQAYLLAAADGGQGIAAVRLDDASGVESVQALDDTGGTYLANVSDMALVELDGALHVFAGSAREHGLTGARLTPEGGLERGESLGRDESLPVQTVTALATAEVAGQPFLLVAASDSSSLTVLAVAGDGTLDVADHVIDDRETRFAGATQLEVVSLQGQVFVLAAGRDAGLSLFRLTAEGRLVHLDSLADGADMALDGVSGLAAQARAGGLDILTTAAGDAGLSLFRVDFEAAGAVTQAASGRLDGTGDDDMLSLRNAAGDLRGGAGEDILSDGPGSDTLRGGPGADLFVLRADGARDMIADFTLGEDRLDLSLWPFLRNAGQIDIESTGQGAVLRFGAEDLALRNSAEEPFEADDLPVMLHGFLSHVDVTLGPLETAPPPPGPDPFPDTVPPVPAPAPSSDGDEPDEAAPQTLLGGEGDDRLEGGPGDDVLAGRGGNDTLRGQGGDDMLAASDGDDLADGGAGRDNMGGGPGDDTLRGGAGRDTMGGGLGNDIVLAGDGDDVMSGGPDDDLVEGGAGDDTLAGSFGTDTVQGQGGADSVGGGPGSDRLAGGAGADLLGGGEGNDTVSGGPGDDFLAGGGRHDRLDAGAGHDTLNAGSGDDVMTGGSGADLFVFNELAAGERDRITDFQPDADMLRLTGVEGRGQVGRFDALGIVETGQGAQLRYDGHRILLEEVSPGDLSLDMFIFL